MINFTYVNNSETTKIQTISSTQKTVSCPRRNHNSDSVDQFGLLVSFTHVETYSILPSMFDFFGPTIFLWNPYRCIPYFFNYTISSYLKKSWSWRLIFCSRQSWRVKTNLKCHTFIDPKNPTISHHQRKRNDLQYHINFE